MSKQTLIFIHGFRGNSLGLAEIARKLSDTYICKVIDIPPFGNSKPLKAYTPDTYAKFIANYIKRNNIKKPILVGHSMGSIIAAATAEKYPNLLHKKLILLAPISKKPPFFVRLIQPSVTLFSNEIVSFITTRFLAVKESKDKFKETLNLTIKCGEKYTSKHALKQSAKFSVRYSVKDFSIKNKTLLLSGETDRLINRRATEKLAKNLPENSETIFLKDTGHLLNYEKPDEIAINIRNFLKTR